MKKINNFQHHHVNESRKKFDQNVTGREIEYKFFIKLSLKKLKVLNFLFGSFFEKVRRQT